MLKFPKITIVTATLNSSRTLEQTILTVASQSYNNIEFIIIDGGSVDGTVDIIKQYKKYISFWVSEKDFGIYDAFNKGIEKSTGDYVCFLGSDDALCSNNSIDKVAEYLDEDIDVLCANVWQVDETYPLQKLSNSAMEFRNLNQSKCMPHHQGMFTRRSLLVKYKFDIKYKIAADYDLFWKIYSQPNIKITCIDEAIVFFASGLGASSNHRNGPSEYLEIMRKNSMPSKVIKKYEIKYLFYYNINRIIIEFAKNVIKKIDLFVFLKKKMGWTIHQCSTKKCRWCELRRD